MILSIPLVFRPVPRPLNRRERSLVSAALALARTSAMGLLWLGMLVAFASAGTKKGRDSGKKCGRADGLKLMFDGSHDRCKCAPDCSCCSDSATDVLIVMITGMARCYDGCCSPNTFFGVDTIFTGLPGGTFTCYANPNLSCNWLSGPKDQGLVREYWQGPGFTGPCQGGTYSKQTMSSVSVNKTILFGETQCKWEVLYNLEGFLMFWGFSDAVTTCAAGPYTATTNVTCQGLCGGGARKNDIAGGVAEIDPG